MNAENKITTEKRFNKYESNLEKQLLTKHVTTVNRSFMNKIKVETESITDATHVPYDIAENVTQKLMVFDETVDSKPLEFTDYIVSWKQEPRENCINECYVNIKYEGEETNQLHNMKQDPLIVEGATCISQVNMKDEEAVNNEIYKCLECTYKSNICRNYINHIIKHEINMFLCNICNKQYYERRSLRLHVLAHSVTKKIEHRKHTGRKNVLRKQCKCSQCWDKISFKRGYNRHIVTHDETKTYGCTVCTKRFLCSKKLKRHSYIHSEAKRFQCVYCEYKTNRKRYLTLHWKDKHVQEKNYKCTMCSYETNNNSHLKIHFKRHLLNNDKEFKCSYCTYETDVKGHLKRHLSVHSNMKPFQCDMCDQFFRRKDNLQRHIWNKHTNGKKV